MHFVARALATRMDRYLTLFPAVAISGPRQSGKSTFVRAALPDAPYVSFDDPEEVRAVESDPRGFLARFPGRVVLDEVQRVPELFPYLKLAIDADRGRPGRFVLTGSNQFALSLRNSESLAGRVGLLALLPFERSEMPAASRGAQMLRGSWPELAVRNHEASREWYASYLATYLERDVRAVHGVGKLADFRSLVALLAARVAQEYNASVLARELGVDSKTVEAWVSALEAGYLVFRLRPWHGNVGKRLIKRPKLYFWDTGLACHLAGIRDREALEAGPLAGPVFENFVAAEILKADAHRGLGLEVYHFRESNGTEADLVLVDRDAGRVTVAETKLAHTAKAPWTDPLRRAADTVARGMEMEGARLKFRTAVAYRGETRGDWPAPGNDFMNYEEFLAGLQAPARPAQPPARGTMAMTGNAAALDAMQR